MRVAEGDGFSKLAKGFIDIGVSLNKLPDDKIINEMIPSRKMITNKFKKLYELEDEKVRARFAKICREKAWPAVHFSFDLWSDRGGNHMLESPLMMKISLLYSFSSFPNLWSGNTMI